MSEPVAAWKAKSPPAGPPIAAAAICATERNCAVVARSSIPMVVAVVSAQAITLWPYPGIQDWTT